MNKFIFITLAAITPFLSVRADQIIPDEMQATFECLQPYNPINSEENEELDANQSTTTRALPLTYELFENVDAVVKKTIKWVSINGDKIVLDDESIFQIDLKWAPIAKKWTFKDKIYIVYYAGNWVYPDFRIINTTRNEYVYSQGLIKKTNTLSDVMTIKEVKPKGIILTNKNVMLQMDDRNLAYIYMYWSAGDQIQLYLDPNVLDGSLVRAYNSSLNLILFNVKVLSPEEAEAILE